MIKTLNRTLKYSLLTLFFSVLIQFVAQSQTKNYPKDQFQSPIRRQLNLSGSFAELRTNHFHSGIDLRIGGVEGEKVYSPYQGAVTRLKIQAWGGGKNLYIEHSNGYTTVYMHLRNYSPKIEKYVREYQYANQTYEFDIPVPKGELIIEKGELIAYAGNTGSSGGPHLHFEVRDTKTQYIINPQHFGLDVIDNSHPYINSILIRPEGVSSRVEGMPDKQIYKVIGPNQSRPRNQKAIRPNDTIEITNMISLGIQAFDKSSGSTSRNGIYSYKLLIDNEIFWTFKIDEFSFDKSRYINACIDYELYKNKKQKYLITKQLPNNQFADFKTYNSSGVISLKPNTIKKIEYILQDYKENTTSFVFYIRGVVSNPNLIINAEFSPTQALYWHKDNIIEDNQFRIELPKNSLYETAEIDYRSSIDLLTQYPVLKIESNSALHSNMEIVMPIPNIIRPEHRTKIVVVEQKGRFQNSIGGKTREGIIIASTRSFGTYSIALDTISPTVFPKNFKSNGKLRPKQNTLTLRIKDELSGIARYKGYINDKWVLMEYDGKTATLTYNIDNKELNQSTNNLRIELQDEVGNATIKSFTVIK
ncbi:MAG TPA: M23 family metallopeptidase [Bacteroidales bacterium]|nr:M23 family metallopeptidase [Bacteroidales bacterium]